MIQVRAVINFNKCFNFHHNFLYFLLLHGSRQPVPLPAPAVPASYWALCQVNENRAQQWRTRVMYLVWNEPWRIQCHKKIYIILFQKDVLCLHYLASRAKKLKPVLTHTNALWQRQRLKKLILKELFQSLLYMNQFTHLRLKAEQMCMPQLWENPGSKHPPTANYPFLWAA